MVNSNLEGIILKFSFRAVKVFLRKTCTFIFTYTRKKKFPFVKNKYQNTLYLQIEEHVLFDFVLQLLPEMKLLNQKAPFVLLYNKYAFG